MLASLHLGLLLASAAAQSHLWSEVAAPLPHVPVFLRFKKSGTGAAENELFRRVCVPKDAAWTGHWQFDEEGMPALYGYNSEFNRERTNISRATPNRVGGADEIARYMPTRVKMFTLIRDPLERVASSLYFWSGELKATPLGEVSPANISRYRACDWDGCVYFPNIRSTFVPNVAPVLSRTLSADRVSAQEHCVPACERDVSVAEGDRRAREAARALAADFIVGITERMDDFVALAYLELGGAATLDARRICVRHDHRQKKPSGEVVRSWPDETVRAVNATLRHEWQVYAAAKNLFERRVAAHGPEAFAAARAAIAAGCDGGGPQKRLPKFTNYALAAGAARELALAERGSDYAAALRIVVDNDGRTNASDHFTVTAKDDGFRLDFGGVPAPGGTSLKGLDVSPCLNVAEGPPGPGDGPVPGFKWGKARNLRRS